MTDGLPARRVALEIAGAVTGRGRTLDEALEASADFPRLPPRDRGFARHLVATLLRRLPEVDAALARLLSKPLPERAWRVRLALRLGAVQLLFLGTPAHAAVSTSVALLAPKESPYRGLVNAVLRRLAREGRALEGAEAGRVNTPDWLLERWQAAYGRPAAEAIATAHLAEPPLDLTLRQPESAAEWAERLGATLLPGGSLRLPPGAGEIQRLPGFEEGAWWVQDAAAALPARLLAAQDGEAVADICAAPGGKTLQLAAAGAQVTAVDLSPQRLERVQENLVRTRLSAELVAADATAWQPGRSFAAVLLDAPCSATGTLRRHPDLALLRRPEDLPALTALQARLLAAAAALVAPGGRLVYAVCALEPEEGEQQIERFLAENAAFRRRPLRSGELGGDELGGGHLGGLAELVTPQGDLRTLPSHFGPQGGLDGFYAARLERAG